MTLRKYLTTYLLSHPQIIFIEHPRCTDTELGLNVNTVATIPAFNHLEENTDDETNVDHTMLLNVMSQKVQGALGARGRNTHLGL